ncbi:MAG TPA: shikimate dehydrogenase [Terriglobales bacterium]|nr:shikimate dehydrogenase [Terriglobales bacterium]
MNTILPSLPTRLMPLRIPRICVAVAGGNPAELLDKAESVARDNPFIEFRLDYLKTPAQALPKIKSFLGSHTYVTAIGTCRRAVNGGLFKGSVAAQVDLLSKAGQAGCHFVDVELQSATAMKAQDFSKIRSYAGLILSFHDFKHTRKVNETFAEMSSIPADIYKVVTTATNLHDNVVMMRFLEEQSHNHKMVGLCMGEQGIISRVLSLRAGSLFTFGAFSPGEETAPGQVTAKALRDAYRIENVDAATRVYGVAGDPIEHSLSPQMMNAAFRRENLNSVYLALHAKSLDDLVKCAREIPIHGMSITMPYKQEIIKHLDNCEPLCEKVGACNTVIRSQEGKLYGFNTDVAGVTRPLEARIPLAGSKVLVLGAGGAARAAVFGLREKGANVFILNRTPQTAQKLARESGAKTIRRDELKKQQFDVIINATPVGMGNGKAILDESEMNARIAFDLVYNPMDTKFLQMARAKGMTAVPGVEMFVHQGARQFEIWTGKPAPSLEMQQVVVNELVHRAPLKAPAAPAKAAPKTPAKAAPAKKAKAAKKK